MDWHLITSLKDTTRAFAFAGIVRLIITIDLREGGG